MNAKPESLFRSPSALRPLPAQQRGVVLFIALITLVAMTLAAIALIRSVETTTQIAGNLAFKQAATTLGDAGTEVAVQWLKNNQDKVISLQQPNSYGYDATDLSTKDITGTTTKGDPTDDIDWDGTNSLTIIKARILTDSELPASMRGGAYTVSYIITRLCTGAGTLTNSMCGTSPGTGTASTSSKTGAVGKAFSGTPQANYRITTRTKGPHNTVSYTQTMVR